MTREYLFRGQRKDNKEWVYGHYLTFKYEKDDGLHVNTNHGHFIFPIGQDEGGMHYEVIPETIGQYTGQNDKKANRIFEHDIIRFADQYYYEVRFEDGKFVGYHANAHWGKWGDLCRLNDYGIKEYHFEVIGNIFDNPVLLTTVK